ncbi:putative reverse transcriptase zinc-binding domain-containing protein [Helianthus annuus]|nr:putative reverse transcriptase zinc-binding domain-containing protein [Helianthus annuus]
MNLNRVPTVDNLLKRNIGVSDLSCQLCNSSDESVYHSFIACYIASLVWNGISVWCKIPPIFAFSTQDLFSIYSGLGVSEKKKEIIQGVIMVACWSIWRARNSLRFSNSPVKIEGILSEIKTLSFLWYSSRSKCKRVEWKDWISFVNM